MHKKTKALLISELKSYLPETFFDDADNNRIETDKTMKILGFHFSEDADMAAQVAAIRRKFVSRVWILRNLRSRGFSTEYLLKLYKSVIQPVHNYCSCVYNSSLTITQSGVLERLQAQALKAIYGYENLYRSLLELSGLQRLKYGRDERSDKFATKCLASPSSGVGSLPLRW